MLRKEFPVLCVVFVLVFVCSFSVASPKAKATEDDLVAHFTFDGDLKDSSGHGNDGSSVGDITFVEAKLGKGAKFDGSAYIRVKDANSLDLKNELTFSVWLYREESDEVRMSILCKGESDDFFESAYRFYLGYGSTSAEISLIDENQSDNDEHTSNATVTPHNWTHVAVSWDGKRATFFKNGAPATVIKTEISTMYSNEDDLIIGLDCVDGVFYKGIMDELRIYDRALSDVEIKSLYELAPVSTTPVPPVAEPGEPVTMVLQIDNPRMKVNGIEREVDPGYGTKPILIEGRTSLPIRAIVEAMGGTIEWEQAEKKLSINVGERSLDFWVDRNDFIVNGVSKTTDVPPVVINGRTMLPLRVVVENLGCHLEWDSQTNTATIISGR